jgi:hypothetical protein
MQQMPAYIINVPYELFVFDKGRNIQWSILPQTVGEVYLCGINTIWATIITYEDIGTVSLAE